MVYSRTLDAEGLELVQGGEGPQGSPVYSGTEKPVLSSVWGCLGSICRGWSGPHSVCGGVVR